jgi:hypothetical protein
MIPMVAMVAFDRDGKRLQAGDTFNAYPIEAASLRYKKKADFASRRAAPSQSYQTRHMTAAQPGSGSPRETPREASQDPAQTAEGEASNTTDAGARSRRGGRGQNYGTRQMRVSEKE